MELSEILYQYNNDILMKLAGLCNCAGAKRKDDLVRCIHKVVMTPTSLRGLWQQLDELSKKAIALAYHNDGEFNRTAFIAQYHILPARPKGKWDWDVKPIMLDLFLYSPGAYQVSPYFNDLYGMAPRIPTDLMPLLEELVPPPEKFQVTGVVEAPQTALNNEHKKALLRRADTEEAGLHDLTLYLGLVNQNKIPTDYASGRTNIAGVKQIAAGLLTGDFFPLEDKFRANQTIRPFGLDVFARESGLVVKGGLSQAGRQFYQTQDMELLLEAFEKWTQQGAFDELSRISGIKGQKARGTVLTKPAGRREAVIEALSWCPVGVWVDLEEFCRALKIWRFDFEVEAGTYSGLYIGYKDYGGLYGSTYWSVVKASYIKAVLWEYLGSIGALDLLYFAPEEAPWPKDAPYLDDILSPYDGLCYFRINNLGAYLLGQAGEYVPAKPVTQTLFTISPELALTLAQPQELTPSQRSVLEQLAAPVNERQYKLDTQRLLSTLEAGGDLDFLVSFLHKHHSGPLPSPAVGWLEQVRFNLGAFKDGGAAKFIKVRSPELVELVLNDPALRKFCDAVDKKTIVIPANKEKVVRTRLKELEYLVLD